MNIEHLHLVFFSPVFHTRAITRMLGGNVTKELSLPGVPAEHDITDFSQASPALVFGPSDLTILAAPVYGGRLPYPAAQRLMLCRGKETPAILVVSYGSRAFDDALLEMKDIAEKQGFLPIAAAASPLSLPPSEGFWPHPPTPCRLCPLCPETVPTVCSDLLPCPRQWTTTIASGAACARRNVLPAP